MKERKGTRKEGGGDRIPNVIQHNHMIVWLNVLVWTQRCFSGTVIYMTPHHSGDDGVNTSVL